MARSHQCVDVVNELMGMALGSVYVQRVFDDQSSFSGCHSTAPVFRQRAFGVSTI